VPAIDLPGNPKLMRPGSAPVPAVANAEDKVRLYSRPAPTEAGARLADGRAYATYFRVAMGFDDKAHVAWAHLHGADFVGGAAMHGGVILCDEQGKVTALDQRTGGTLAQLYLGQPVQACLVNVDAYRAAGEPKDAKPLAAQLGDVVRAEDAQLSAVQTVLLQDMTSLPDETVTKTLVELISDPRTEPALAAPARSALAGRRNGGAYLAAALQRHYDYLRDVLQSPPVGPIAQALAAMKDQRAAPLLAAHLLDPADSNEDVRQAAAALAVVAGPEQMPALRQFFGMYRANAETDEMVEAVASVGQALIAVEEKSGRATVEAAVRDADTAPRVRERLRALLERPASK
jgi:outer membrane protein assembly factor BamB